jgi:hypothetical protein
MKTKVVNDTSVGIGNVLNDETPKRNRNVALFITWAIMGLWHGANWTFIFWGVYHATFIFIERMIDKYKPHIMQPGNVIKNIITWLIVIPIVMLSWIPFRATNMEIVFQMYSKLFVPSQYLRLGMQENTYIICATLFLLTTLTYLFKNYCQPKIKKYKIVYSSLTILAYSIMILLVFTFLRPISQFIYFQF